MRTCFHKTRVSEELAQPLSVFFFQAEDGIRDSSVTGVQTCALPISPCGESQRAKRARTLPHAISPRISPPLSRAEDVWGRPPYPPRISPPVRGLMRMGWALPRVRAA